MEEAKLLAASTHSKQVDKISLTKCSENPVSGKHDIWLNLVLIPIHAVQDLFDRLQIQLVCIYMGSLTYTKSLTRSPLYTDFAYVHAIVGFLC